MSFLMSNIPTEYQQHRIHCSGCEVVLRVRICAGGVFASRIMVTNERIANAFLGVTPRFKNLLSRAFRQRGGLVDAAQPVRYRH